VATIANIKDLDRRIDYLGDFRDGLGHTPYILGFMSPNDHLRGALNLARGVIMQAVFDGAVDLPCGSDFALVAHYLMEMQVAATSISAYNPGLVGRGIWEGAEIGAGEDGGGVGNVDSAEEMSRKGEVVIAGLRAAYQKRFEQELEEKHKIMLIVFMKMYKKVQKGLTTTGVPEFYSLADLPLNNMKPRILDGREVKDAVTKLTLGERNSLVSHVQAGCGEIFDTVERVLQWDEMERYLTVKSLMNMQLKGLVDLMNNRNLVGFGG